MSNKRLQEIFNAGVLGVLKQGAYSSINGICEYRSNVGCKRYACFIGHSLTACQAEAPERTNRAGERSGPFRAVVLTISRSAARTGVFVKSNSVSAFSALSRP